MDTQPQTASARRIVRLNDLDRIVGEDHYRAKLTDHDVWMLLEVHEAGIGYRRLARMFAIPRATVQSICNGRRRGQTAVRQKVVAAT